MKKLIAANWKMNSVPAGALEKSSPYHSTNNVDVLVFPTAIDLHACIDAGLPTGAQCGHPKDSGAFTGDIGMAMLKNIGCTAVLCGHSDRRANHGETDDFVGSQVAAAFVAGLLPVACVGETWEERKNGQMKEVLDRQVMIILDYAKHTSSDAFVLAYEPVWAISQGDPNKPPASTADAAEAHKFIRSLLPEKLKKIRILYGGSMKGSNAADLLAQPNIDGGLVGGASLKPDDFAKIVEAAK